MAPQQPEEHHQKTPYSYYPGCSLHGTALEYDTSVRELARILDIELVELPDWNCCGASSAHMTDHGLAHDLAVRNIRIAEGEGRDVIIPCAACFQRLKAAQNVLKEASRTAGNPASGIAILHLSELLRNMDILEKIRSAVRISLQGLKLAPYYGCLITRPPSVTGSPEHEDPKSIDILVRILGGKTTKWSFKTECCGGSLAMPRPDIVRALVSKLIKAAVAAGAQGIVTMCPMCQANLDSRQLDLLKQDEKHPVVPVFFASELVIWCVSGGTSPRTWKRHLIDPTPVLELLDRVPHNEETNRKTGDADGGSLVS